MINEKRLTEEIALLLKDVFESDVTFCGETIKMAFMDGQTFSVKVEQLR